MLALICVSATIAVAKVWGSFISYESANWGSQLAWAIAAIPSIIVANTKYPQVNGFLSKLLKVLRYFAVTVHKDSPGTLKAPIMQSKPPLAVAAPPAAPVAPPTAGMASVGLLAALSVALLVVSCATVSWNTPVVFSGPAAAITEVNVKTGSTASIGAGGGYQLTVGDGELNWVNHSWDMVDVSAIALGSVFIPNGGGPVGVLQVGGCLGTLNGIISGCMLSTPYADDGSGFAQGGRPGATLGAIIDVQAIIADFGALAASKKMRARYGDGDAVPLPRGGF